MSKEAQIMLDHSQIEKITEELVKEKFNNSLKLYTIEVADNVDHEENDVIDIDIIYENDERKLDANITFSFTRYLLQRLDDEEEHRFPVVSYISRADYESQKAEAV